MSLRVRLVLMLWLVTAVAGLATLVLSATDAYRTVARDMHGTLARAGYVLERNYRMAPRANDPLHAERTAIDLLGVMAPGTCLRFEQREITQRRLCAGWQVFGPIAPAAFREGVTRVFALPPPLERSGSASQDGDFTLIVTFDPVAAATLAWQRVRLALWQTVAMASGILVLGTVAILWRLGPVGGIVAELDRLARGDLGARVEPGGAREFRRIARAVNRLAARLRRGAAESRALTRKLIEVEDVERRQLARDLHDEFGQTLTATGAVAASIACAAPPDRPDIARDADAIGANIRSMMACLRDAFARLRPPDLAEIGLAASLRTMLSGWETRGGTALTLDYGLADDALPDAVALDLYRIVQECVTNAIRHGDPRQVRVAFRQVGGAVELEVEDDGGGRLGHGDAGHGILGITERVGAMDGRLRMEETPAGIRVRVTVPAPSESRAA